VVSTGTEGATKKLNLVDVITGAKIREVDWPSEAGWPSSVEDVRALLPLEFLEKDEGHPKFVNYGAQNVAFKSWDFLSITVATLMPRADSNESRSQLLAKLHAFGADPEAQEFTLQVRMEVPEACLPQQVGFVERLLRTIDAWLEEDPLLGEPRRAALINNMRDFLQKGAVYQKTLLEGIPAIFSDTTKLGLLVNYLSGEEIFVTIPKELLQYLGRGRPRARRWVSESDTETTEEESESWLSTDRVGRGRPHARRWESESDTETTEEESESDTETTEEE